MAVDSRRNTQTIVHSILVPTCTPNMATSHHVAGAVLAFLRSCRARAMGVGLVRNVGVVGGMLAGLPMSLLGWVGLFLPLGAPMHQAATLLVTVATVWLMASLGLAHAVLDAPRCAQSTINSRR